MTIIKNQDLLSPASDALRAFAKRADGNFSDLEVDPVANRISVFRVGGSDAPAEIIDGYRAAAGGTTIGFEDATLTSSQIDAIDTSLEFAATQPEVMEPTESASWGTDRPGGTFTVWYSDASPQNKFQQTLAAKGQLSDALSELLAGIKYQHIGPVVPANGRFDNTSPYTAGSYIKPSGCSTGFGLRTPGRTQSYQSTAWHCIPQGNNTVNTGTNALLGTVSSNDSYTDSAYIAIPGGKSSTPFIFDGFYPNATQRKQVVGYSLPDAGDRVCLSGATSYARCNGQIGTGRTWTTFKSTGQTATVHGSLVSSTDGTWLIAKGDSGGPVFQNTNGNTQALAYGTISALNPQSGYCPSWMSAGAQCGPWGYISLARDMHDRHNVVFNW